ncbi:hypothetical protein [Rickettsia endosymbiont of Ceutorhynchus obstrictus]
MNTSEVIVRMRCYADTKTVIARRCVSIDVAIQLNIFYTKLV